MPHSTPWTNAALIFRTPENVRTLINIWLNSKFRCKHIFHGDLGVYLRTLVQLSLLFVHIFVYQSDVWSTQHLLSSHTLSLSWRKTTPHHYLFPCVNLWRLKQNNSKSLFGIQRSCFSVWFAEPDNMRLRRGSRLFGKGEPFQKTPRAWAQLATL